MQNFRNIEISSLSRPAGGDQGEGERIMHRMQFAWASHDSCAADAAGHPLSNSLPQGGREGIGRSLLGLAATGLVLIATACSPTVKVEAPDKPIEINMNIKIDQEVRVKVDKALDDAIASDPALFGSSAAGAVKQEEGKKP